MYSWLGLPSEPLFLSTLSLRRATHVQRYRKRDRNISIHALLAESDGVLMGRVSMPQGISIHALLAESDNGPMTKGQVYYIISIHALLAESDAVRVP